MNIRVRLETEHSKTLTIAIVNYIGSDKKRFKELMMVFFESDYLLAQRAAWPLSYVLIAHPELAKPYFKKLVEKLGEPDNHPAINRNILRAFQEIDIPQKYWGLLVDQCFKFIMNEAQALAVRAFAITVAARICKHYPELKRELILIMKELSSLPQAPAIKVRIKSALKEVHPVDLKV